MQTKLECALSLASRGFFVFPLSPNSKIPPPGMKWRDLSSTYSDSISKWWTENPDYNIGIDTGKSGLYVIDVDVKDGKKGAATREKLDMLYGFDPTLEAVTATGGQHIIYSTSEHFSNTAGALGEGIDTRGWGGYIVGPGSSIDRKFYIFNEATASVPKPLPEWVAARLKDYAVRSRTGNRKDSFSEDSPADIARYKDWLLNTAETAVEGHNGDHITYATAAKGREFGLSADTVLEMLLDHWNDRCSPPWHPEELRVKVENAFRYSRKAQGASSAQADFDAVPPDPTDDVFCPPYTLSDEKDIPDRQWVLPILALRKKVTILAAPPGEGKSTFTMGLGLTCATGKPILGIQPIEAVHVMLQNNEDDFEELDRRMVAMAKYHGIGMAGIYENDAQGATANSRLHMQSGERRPLKIAMRAGQGYAIKPLDAEKLIASLIANKIRLLIVDPFSETHPADENNNNEIQEVAKIYRDVAQKADCAVILVHHDRKPQEASAEGHIGNMYSLRGASSLAGVARIIATYHTMTEKDAKRYGVHEDERRFYARLDIAKANMSISHGEPLWFKRISHRLKATPDDPDSGESVGVLAPAKLTVKKTTEGSATADMLKDIEDIVIDSGPEGMAVAEIARQLIDAYAVYMGRKAEALVKGIKRLFEGDATLAAPRGHLTLYRREREKGSPNAARDYIRWKAL